MDNSTHHMSEQLIRYLDNELTADEKQRLEQQLAADIQLQRELDDLLLAREAIRYFALEQQVAQVQQQLKKEQSPPVRELPKSLRTIRYSISIAAGVLLLLGAYALYNNMNLSAEKVFASRYERYELVTPRDNGTPQTPAEVAYRAGNYREVLRIHDAGEDRTARGEFLCGAASLEIKNNDKAIRCFNEVFDRSPDRLLREEAEYYLSLAYVRNKNYDAALLLLSNIRGNSAHLYHSKATPKLLRQVSRLKKK